MRSISLVSMAESQTSWKAIGRPCLVLAAGFLALLAPELGPALERELREPSCACPRGSVAVTPPSSELRAEVHLAQPDPGSDRVQPACEKHGPAVEPRPEPAPI